MKTYQVTWEIDIEAESPREAAQEALNIQRRISDATVFNVDGEIIDLEDDGECLKNILSVKLEDM